MVHQVTRFSDAYVAWENWNLTDFDTKRECLLSLINTADNELKLSDVMSFHLKHAATLLEHEHRLIGPTGETNELYTAGRGVTLLIHDVLAKDEHCTNARQAIFAQLAAVLIAGNSVIVCSDDNVFTQSLEKAVQGSVIPQNLIQCAAVDDYHQLLESDVRNVGYVGKPSVELTLNRQLSKRDGAIIGLVSETDLNAIPVAHDPHLSLRFITERTRTINITAVGGNATLLELGSDAH